MSKYQVTQREPKSKYISSAGNQARANIIALLAKLWHLLLWIWTILIIGVIVGFLGNVTFTLLTTGRLNFIGTLSVFTWLSAHLALCISILTLLLAITLCSYLAHNSKQQAAESKQHVHEESLIVIAKGVQRALDKLDTKPVPESILASSESTNQDPPFRTRVWYIPYRRNPFFTGREALLKQIHYHLSQATTAAVTGLGGIGKTQTVTEYAYRYHENYQAVLWVRAESIDTITADFVTIAGLLKLPEYETRDLNIAVKAAVRWLEIKTGWLLILDNADDLAAIRNFLPGQSKGHILLTTRAQALSGLAYTFEIEKMKPVEGALFLLRRAHIISTNDPPENASFNERTIAEEISQITDGLPLALDQAGAYIEETACSLSEYLSLYRNRHSMFLNRRGGLVPDHPEPVATTWSLSFEKVEQNNPAAAELLRICSFVHHDTIPEEIILDGAIELGPVLQTIAGDRLELNNAIGELRKFSFVRRNSEISTLSIHPLVQVILRDRMDKVTQHMWAERIVRAISHVFPNVTFETWLHCQRYFQQIEECAQLIKLHDFSFSEATRFLDQAALVLQENAYYTQAEALQLQVLTIREAALGSRHPDTATTLNNLARLYYNQGKFLQAEPLYLRALTIREAALGSRHPDTATTLNNLARLYHTQGKYPQAEPLYLRALTITEQNLGLDHPKAAENLNNLARLYHAQSKYTQAEPLYLQALAITEKNPELKHPDTAYVLNNLALLYRFQGKYAQAEELYLRALAIRETALGPEHPKAAITLNNLARLYATLNKYTQAEELYLRALTIQVATSRPNHPNTASTLNNLGQMYSAQGKYAQAEELYLRALAIRETALGPEHPKTAITLNSLARLYATLNKYTQAEELYLRALTIQNAALGQEHPDLATVLENYIDLLQKTKRKKTAKRLKARVQLIRAMYPQRGEID